MKKILTLLFLAVAARADIPGDGSNTFNSDSKQISISSFSATQIMVVDSFITRSYIINPSTWTGVCVSTLSASLSTSASPAIPPNTVFSIDGPLIPWWGQIFAEVCNALPSGSQPVAQTISVLRTK